MKKFSVNKSKQKIKKIKKQIWFKPLCLLGLVVCIILLIFGSAAVARFSAEKKVSLRAFNGKAEQAGAPDDNAYDIYYDADSDRTSRESGIMVTIGNLYDRIIGDEGKKDVTITSQADTDGFSNGTAKDLATMEKRITESVISQVGTSATEVLEGAAGKDGEPGEKGDRGETGQRGAQGPAGRTGASGKTGSVGATGEKGDPGESGKDGLSTFIVYADTKDGKNMSMTPKETSKFIGTYQGTTRSSDPKDYTWTEYKDKIITYTNDDGKPTIHIFN